MLLSVQSKVFADLLLIQICSQMLKLQRPEQSGFTLGKSAIDCGGTAT